MSDKIRDFDKSVVRADGTFRPGIDFREPGNEIPAPPVIPTVPLPRCTPGIEVREHRIPDFLLRRAPPLVWLVPGGNA